ncbi:hypothetical protein ACT4S5_13065 [Kocuria oceani]|uniref:hypothetical protein n=1 Tax=Kocuria oceani TaxID=988827 RepID=UPI004037296C
MSGAWAATTGDSAWADYQRTARVTSTTLLLKGGPLFDPAKVADNPGYYLLDIFEHEAEAAALWKSRRRRNRYWSEGEIRLRYQGVELLPFGAVDDVSALWCYLVNLVDDFLDTGRGYCDYPDQPLPVVLETVKRTVFFSAEGKRVMVEPVPFLSSLLDEAQRFFDWTERNLGERLLVRPLEEMRERVREEPGGWQL